MLSIDNCIKGTSWFDRFKNADGNSMTFPSDVRVDEIRNEILTLNDWLREMEGYVLHNTANELIEDSSKVFMMEFEHLNSILCRNGKYPSS